MDILELQHKMNSLDASIKMLRKNGEALAQAEHDYKVSLSKESLRLRDSGMAIGMIDKVIYGVPEIAKLRLQRDIAQVLYDANLEHINVTKLQIKIIENQIRREW